MTFHALDTKAAGMCTLLGDDTNGVVKNPQKDGSERRVIQCTVVLPGPNSQINPR
jgi:hypothetical protein